MGRLDRVEFLRARPDHDPQYAGGERAIVAAWVADATNSPA